VLAAAEALYARLATDPRGRGWAPGVAVLVGGTLARLEHHLEAITWLEQGLRALPGTPAARDLAGGHHEHRLLAELHLLTGRWDRADAYLEWLGLPDQPLESRLASLRGRAVLAAARGDAEAGAWLLNAAADLARRSQSRLYATLVDGDRVLVLVAAGRLGEAAALADEVLPRLSAPAPGPTQAWANAQAVVVATTLARRAVEEGERDLAGRLLAGVAVPAHRSGRAYLAAHRDLASAALARLEGHVDAAERALGAATERFERLGALPACALARLEAARLADARGFRGSSLALYRRASQELSALGMAREAGEAGRRVRTLAAPSS
jgi:hypothetical protein